MPASTDYWINDCSGDPLFVITGEVNAALTKALPRNRVRKTINEQLKAERPHIGGKRVQALPGNELLRDLPLEFDAVGTLSGHGFHRLKAQLTLSNH
jgi:hypothetical protein